jgi:hypothetical protein
MPSQHKHPPVSFRPPEGDRAWLLAYAKETGQPVNHILAKALAAFRVSQQGLITGRHPRRDGPTVALHD